MTHCYTHRSMSAPLSPHQRNSETQNWTMHRRWETLENSGLKGMPLSDPSSHSSGVYVEEKVEKIHEPEVVDDSKRAASSRPNGTNVHMNSQRRWQHAQTPFSFKSDKIQTWRRGSRHQVPALIKKVSSTGSAGRERSVFSNWVTLGTAVTRKAPCQGTVGKHDTDSMIFLYTCCFALLTFILLFLQVFWFCFVSEGGRAWSWIGSRKDIGRVGGREPL